MIGFVRRYLVNTVWGLWGPARAFWQHRVLLAMLMRRQVTGQTSGTVLGSLWTLLQPALQMVGFWFLIDVVLRVKYPGRMPFLDYFLVGMLPWLMISDVLRNSLSVMRSMSQLYVRTPFPLELLPLLPLLLPVVIYSGVYLVVVGLLHGPAALPAALLVTVSLALFLLPFAYLLAVTGLFLRDVGQFFPFVLMLGLYVTPILYMPQMLPEWAQALMVFNPFADVMALIHAVVQGSAWESGQLIRLGLYWLLLLGPAWVLYRRSMPHMREAL